MPRIANWRANKANPLAVSPLQFYRRSVFLPLIGTVLEQLNERFCSDLVNCIKLEFFIALVCVKYCFVSIRNAVNFYLPFLDDSIDAVEVEFVQWRLYWPRHKGDPLLYIALGAFSQLKK